MNELDTDQLIDKARAGDSRAQQSLLVRHNDRLRRMIGVFLDARLSARIDPSDIIQEALTCAAGRLPEYLENRPIAFYPWLRQFVKNELVNIHRRHVLAQRRAIGREQQFRAQISDASAMQLANRLVSRETSPSQQLHAEDLKKQMITVLSKLSDVDRELLLMRCVEQLGVDEIAHTLDIKPSTVRSRITGALQKLNSYLKATE